MFEAFTRFGSWFVPSPGLLRAFAFLWVLGPLGVARAEPALQPTPLDEPKFQGVVQSIRRAEALLKSYAVGSTIEVFENEEKKKALSMTLVDSGEDMLALFRSPAYEAGKIVLLNSGSYFFYFPQPNKYIRVSPQNSLFGSISFGDIVKPPLLAFYDIKEAKRSGDLYEIAFTLKEGKTLPYYRKVVRFDAKRSAMERVDSYSRSGILLGTTINLEFQDIKGVAFPSYSKIIDVKRANSYALQRNSAVRTVELPAKLFNPSFLSNVDEFVKAQLGM